MDVAISRNSAHVIEIFHCFMNIKKLNMFDHEDCITSITKNCSFNSKLAFLISYLFIIL